MDIFIEHRRDLFYRGRLLLVRSSCHQEAEGHVPQALKKRIPP